MRIAIIGTGALGSLFAAKLYPCCEVFMVGSWMKAINNINEQGLRIQHRSSEEIVGVKAYNISEDVPMVDCVLILVKGWQTHFAGKLAAKLVRNSGLVITLQNGIGNIDKLSNYISSDSLSMGVTTQGSELLSPGYVRYVGGGDTYLESNNVHLQSTLTIKNIFETAGFSTIVTDDLRGHFWGKLAASSGINAMTALLRIRNGDLLSNEYSVKLVVGAANETANIASSLGIDLPYDISEFVMDVILSTSHNRSSMLQDVMRGAPTEIESINCAIVRIGKEIGIQTPINSMLCDLIRASVAIGDKNANIEVV